MKQRIKETFPKIHENWLPLVLCQECCNSQGLLKSNYQREVHIHLVVTMLYAQ